MRMPRNEGALALAPRDDRMTRQAPAPPYREERERYYAPEPARPRDYRAVTRRYESRRNAPPPRREKPRFRLKAKYVIAGILVFTAIFAVLYRQMRIDGQILELHNMRSTLEDEQKRAEDLSLELALKLDIEKVQNVARDELGMDYPAQGQVKAVVLPPIHNESTASYAADVAPAPKESYAAKDGIAGFFESLMESLR